MKTHILALVVIPALVACSGSPDAGVTSPQDPTTDALQADAGSVCVLPVQGGVACDGFTPSSQAWAWVETSPGMGTASDGGLQSAKCNQIACPSGATCMVENTLADGTEQLLMGKCQ
jgi:hypothetical protein